MGGGEVGDGVKRLKKKSVLCYGYCIIGAICAAVGYPNDYEEM